MILAKPLALAALAASTLGAADDDPRSILVVLAHPDDELFVAPALARFVREGAHVTLVYATPGDAGPGVSGMEPGEDLAARREREAFCAARALGTAGAIVMPLPDGGLGTGAHRPGSPASLFAESIAPFLADRDIVITWGPDGGYGHADHRMVHAIVAQYVQAMPAQSRPRLLFPAIASGTKPPIPQMEDWAETAPDLIDMRITYEAPDLAAANAAAQCHETQFDAATRAQMMALFDASIWAEGVPFRSAFPAPAPPGGKPSR